MKNYYVTPSKSKAVYRVTITADMNDGDYLININEYTRDKFENGLIDELYELNKIVGVEHALTDFIELYSTIPFDTQSGEPCHTLEELKIEYISGNGELFDVKFEGEEQ